MLEFPKTTVHTIVKNEYLLRLRNLSLFDKQVGSLKDGKFTQTIQLTF
jgi:hypothetical protein